MNEIIFRGLTPKERAEWINKRLLESNCRLVDIATEIGIPSSSLSKLMISEGYEFSRKLKQYMVKEEPTLSRKGNQPVKEMIFDYLSLNAEDLIEMIDFHKNKVLVISPAVYQVKSKDYVNKSFKINGEIYHKFQALLSEKYPHYRIQDAVAQALLDFTNRYN